ncbi:hypothetical protein NJB18091_15660 [Mycobacterium marinum]|uniref:hypothetical protein n=1 Tax=Mycobacterium marinum TaxID=1781 RepID=UPI0021C3214E|nr:hypothetical protein [Mycobacterium marinum]GJP28819.1 hypothetical protein NJB18091_15660 [Mycobacterium marinum]
MKKLRTIALWLIGTFAGILLALTLTGAIGPLYRLMVRYLAPEVWSAIGTWLTAIIAAFAALFAWSQVKVARETREEQAQPNVVLYTEPNPADWQILEIVIKNFGTTPAYDINISITPQLQATPDLHSGGKIVDVPVPARIPILAPGQSWKTVWDTATDRKDHMIDLDRKLREEKISTEEYEAQIPRSRHTATVNYTDSKRIKRYETDAELDFNMLDGTTRVDIQTMHDLTKKVESLRDHVQGISDTLQNYTKEHKGVWVYPADADAERSYRVDQNNKLMERIKAAQNRYGERRSNASPPAPSPDSADEASASESATDQPSDGQSRRRDWATAVRKLFGR